VRIPEIARSNSTTHKLNRPVTPNFTRQKMSRQSQRRREATIAQRNSRPNPKPSGPPPIRHKARQKAINNARHDRRGRRGGGQPSRNRRSGDSNGHAEEQDFISFASSGNNFGVLHRSGSWQNPIALDGDDSLEDGEMMSEDDLHMSDSGDMVINVQVDRGHREQLPRATVMFTLVQAVAVYKRLRDAGFPLVRSTVARYGMEEEEVTPHIESRSQTHAPALQYSRVSFKPDAAVGTKPAPVNQPASTSSSRVSSLPSRPPSSSTATSRASTQATKPSTQPCTQASTQPRTQASSQASNSREDHNPARDYVFNWGAQRGKHFRDVPESYLRSIGKSSSVMNCHSGLTEAFDYHKPGLRDTIAAQKAEYKAREPEQAAVRASLRERIQPSRAAKSR
jgi:hypothetical protein